MGFFASRHVGVILRVRLRHPTEPVLDVYSYNFPDDRRYVKILGEHLRLTSIFSQLIRTCD
jgi:hypothetical protein